MYKTQVDIDFFHKTSYKQFDISYSKNLSHVQEKSDMEGEKYTNVEYDDDSDVDPMENYGFLEIVKK